MGFTVLVGAPAFGSTGQPLTRCAFQPDPSAHRRINTAEGMAEGISRNVLQGDFLECFGLGPFDRIVMNSPFADGADIEHIARRSYRRALCQAVRTGATVQLLSKNGKNLGIRFPALLPSLLRALPKESAVDGELVALDPEGRPSFSLIQNAGSNRHPWCSTVLIFLPLGARI